MKKEAVTGLAEVRRIIDLPKVSQVGVVVRDIHRTAELYQSLFGLEPFTIYDFEPDEHWYREQPSPLKIRMAKSFWGPVEYELLQPLEGLSMHQDFLNEHGEGIQHLGFNVRDYDNVFQRMVEAGFQPVMRAESYVPQYDGRLRACYFDTRAVGGLVCEVIWKSWLPECN